MPGTRRFAIRAGTGWYESPALVETPALGAAIENEIDALGGVVDVFLGATPIVVGGTDHHEAHVRIAVTPARPRPRLVRTSIDFDGLATKIESLPDGREIWAYTHELAKHVAFVSGTTVERVPAFARIAPIPDTMSPVSHRACAQPSVQDVAASDRLAYALVVECSEAAPVRLVTFEGTTPTELRLPRTAAFERLAVSRAGKVALVGTRDRALAIGRIDHGDVKLTTHAPAKRVLAAVMADDDAVWAFVLDAHDRPSVVRDGVAVDLGAERTASALAYDTQLGVVVLARGPNASWLFAERPPGTALRITPR